MNYKRLSVILGSTLGATTLASGITLAWALVSRHKWIDCAVSNNRHAENEQQGRIDAEFKAGQLSKQVDKLKTNQANQILQWNRDSGSAACYLEEASKIWKSITRSGINENEREYLFGKWQNMVTLAFGEVSIQADPFYGVHDRNRIVTEDNKEPTTENSTDSVESTETAHEHTQDKK